VSSISGPQYCCTPVLVSSCPGPNTGSSIIIIIALVILSLTCHRTGVVGYVWVLLILTFLSEPAVLNIFSHFPLVARSTEDWLKKKDRYQRRPGCGRSPVSSRRAPVPGPAAGSSDEDCLLVSCDRGQPSPEAPDAEQDRWECEDKYSHYRALDSKTKRSAAFTWDEFEIEPESRQIPLEILSLRANQKEVIRRFVSLLTSGWFSSGFYPVSTQYTK